MLLNHSSSVHFAFSNCKIWQKVYIKDFPKISMATSLYHLNHKSYPQSQRNVLIHYSH